MDKDKAENELVINIKKATSPEETAPKQKHVRSLSHPVHTIRIANDPNQNVSFILGIITLQYLSGMVYGCNLFLRTRFKHSKLSSLYTRSYRKAIRWYVITENVVNYWFTLGNQTLKESHGQTAWLETCARTVGSEGQKGTCRVVLVDRIFMLCHKDTPFSSKLMFNSS